MRTILSSVKGQAAKAQPSRIESKHYEVSAYAHADLGFSKRLFNSSCWAEDPPASGLVVDNLRYSAQGTGLKSLLRQNKHSSISIEF